MYRRLSNSLPPDPEFPADLEKLGYFLNSDDEIRSIEDPTQFFEYFINRNERYNEKNREAMNTCIRQIVLERLHALGIETLRLPLGTPSNKPHIPILVSRNISTRKRIILVIPEALQDLGIWAYRIIGSAGKDAMNRGSAVNFVKYVKNLGLHHAGNGVNEGDGGNDENTPGIIIANTGQLVWYRGGKRAVSFTTWDSLPRKSAVHGSMRIDDVRNRVPKNSSVKEHVKYIFEEILDNGEMVKKDIEVYVIGLSDGADEVVGYLNGNWTNWSSKIKALALSAPLHQESDITDRDFAQFLKEKARGYILSPLPPLTPLPKSDWVPGNIPTFSSGEEWFNECIMPVSYFHFVDFFEQVHREGEGFVNFTPPVIITTTATDEGMVLGDMVEGIENLGIGDDDNDGNVNGDGGDGVVVGRSANAA